MSIEYRGNDAFEVGRALRARRLFDRRADGSENRPYPRQVSADGGPEMRARSPYGGLADAMSSHPYPLPDPLPPPAT